MIHLACQTPGCGGFQSSEPPESLLFCQRCGWPLGQGEYLAQGGRVTYPKGDRGELSIQVRNVGTGALRWDVCSLPDGVRRLDLPNDIPPGAEGCIMLEVDGSRFQGTEIVIPLRTWDKHGRDKLDYRLIPPDEAFNEGTVTFSTRTTKVGPLICHTDAVLFFPRDRKQSFTLKNEGETALKVSLECTNCCVTVALCSDLRGRQTSGEFNLDAGLQRTLEVRLDDGVRNGSVSLSCPQAWANPHLVQAVRIDPAPLKEPKHQYVVAIDFGTTKSAVMVFDQWQLGATPQPILWPKPDGKQEWYIPSEVRFTNDKPTDFGWLAGDSSDVVRSVKTQLLEGSDRAKRCVTYLLERIFDRVAERYDSELLANAQVVMSLPVLDDGERADLQRRTTLDCALAAGRKYGLQAEQLITYSEPECALVDILDSMKKGNEAGGAPVPTPSDGDWLCVVDIGGGTTDISLTQFGLAESGRPELRNLKVAGFSRAGDFVDQELFLHCLRSWRDAGRINETCPTAFVPELLNAPLKLKGETAPQPQARVFEEIRRAKEYMYDHNPARPYTLESFGIKRNHLPLQPEELDRVIIRSTVKALFEGSVGAGEPSFRHCLEDWGIPVDQIRFLFLTGGTSRLPSVPEILKSEYLRWPKLTTLPNSEPRKNVVRGAALRPNLRLPNMLPVDLILRLGDKSKDLRKGSVPGAGIEVPYRVDRGCGIDLQVLMQLAGESLPLATFRLELSGDAPEQYLMTKAFLRYTLDCKLEVDAKWLKEPPDLLPPTVVASFPREGA